MQRIAKITSKGQVTIPSDIRKALGVVSGDQIVFEKNGDEIRVLPKRAGSRFEKYRGIGGTGITGGREGVIRYFRELRGE
jgi:AbrB family looped-hinge helix DNA binding protein